MATPTAGVMLQKLKFNQNNNTFFMMKLHRGLEASADLQGVRKVTLGLSVYSQHLQLTKTHRAHSGNIMAKHFV